MCGAYMVLLAVSVLVHVWCRFGSVAGNVWFPYALWCCVIGACYVHVVHVWFSCITDVSPVWFTPGYSAWHCITIGSGVVHVVGYCVVHV